MKISKSPFFLTVDTEGDNSWDKPIEITSRNVEQLHRFQELCNKYDIKPIYLTNFEAADNKLFQRFVNENFDRLEIGLHLHAWNSPPDFNLTGDDYYYQPYLHEYPDEIIKSKIEYLVKKLQDTFGTEVISHRGGRYSISEMIFETLAKNGIRVDCSVVPGFNWETSLGDPSGKGGPDFSKYENLIYEIFPGITEIPVSTLVPKSIFSGKKDTFLPKRIYSKVFHKHKMVLRSKLNNFDELKKVTDWHIKQNNHLEYIIHSSELVAGTSRLINNENEEDIFYSNLEVFFVYLQNNNVKSQTFKEFISSTQH